MDITADDGLSVTRDHSESNPPLPFALPTILIVEDNLAHQKITEYVLRRDHVVGQFRVVRDGEEALDYLFRRKEYADEASAPKPDLILLDLNLPKRDGREVLRMIKDNAALKPIPVIIVSTSDREEDILDAMQKGAVAYVSKSSGFDRFAERLAEVVRSVCENIR